MSRSTQTPSHFLFSLTKSKKKAMKDTEKQQQTLTIM